MQNLEQIQQQLGLDAEQWAALVAIAQLKEAVTGLAQLDHEQLTGIARWLEPLTVEQIENLTAQLAEGPARVDRDVWSW